MPRRRCNYIRKPELACWKAEGEHWYAERADLEAAITASKRTEEDIKKKMGVGYHHLEDALNGKRLDHFEVGHVEWGIVPDIDSPKYSNKSLASKTRT